MENGNTMKTNYYQRKVVGIYLIQHRETLRSYCGQSRDVLSRWRAHCSGGKKAVGIGAAIRDEGVDSFIFRVLEECSVSQLNEREVFWIQHHDCVEPHGYNRNSGGGAPTHVSDKTKAKLSAKAKGRSHSPEAIEKCRAAKKGHIVSDETKEKIRAARVGKTHSPEARAKMTATRKGKLLSSEHREKISAGHLRRAREARSAAIEAISYAAPLQKLTDTLRYDRSYVTIAEDGTPLSAAPAPSLAELEEMLGLL